MLGEVGVWSDVLWFWRGGLNSSSKVGMRMLGDREKKVKLLPERVNDGLRAQEPRD